jgi:hypothetical protein
LPGALEGGGVLDRGAKLVGRPRLAIVAVERALQPLPAKEVSSGEFVESARGLAPAVKLGRSRFYRAQRHGSPRRSVGARSICERHTIWEPALAQRLLASADVHYAARGQQFQTVEHGDSPTT